MKSRLIAGALLLGLVALVVPACSDGNTVESGSEKTSETRPGGSSSKGGGSKDGGSSDTSIPDLGSVAGSMGSCMEVAGAYASLALGALGGPEGAKKSQQQAEQLKQKLPAELADDIDVVAQTFGKIADQGFLDGAGALNDPEFTKANRNITDYLQTTCSGG